MKATARQLIESVSKTLSKARQKWAVALLEDDAMDPALTAPVEDAPTDPDQALADGFEAAILAVVKDETMDAAAKAKKIAALLKTHEKLTAEPEPEAPSETPAEEGEDADEKDKKMESRLRELEAKDACRDLCESMDFTPNNDQLAALVAIPHATARKTVAQAFKDAKGGKSQTGPRSKAMGGSKLTESREPAQIDAKGLASALLN